MKGLCVCKVRIFFNLRSPMERLFDPAGRNPVRCNQITHKVSDSPLLPIPFTHNYWELWRGALQTTLYHIVPGHMCGPSIC